MSAVLRVENLSYKDVLDNVCFEIEKNTFNVLVGPNSCGKTLLVKCLGGLLEYSGSIYLNNWLVTDKNNEANEFSNRKNIGIVIDLSSCMSGSVLSNLVYPLLNLGYSEIDAKKKIYAISDKLDTGYLLMKNISELKFFEMKLFYFMRGIVHEPKIIVIDDIFDSLSSYYKEKIFNYLKKMNSRTVLFMTSNEEYVLYGENVIIMNNGKIITQSSLQEILNDERKFTKNNLKLPFVVDLSHKLKSYELIDDITLEIDEMVNEIWE